MNPLVKQCDMSNFDNLQMVLWRLQNWDPILLRYVLNHFHKVTQDLRIQTKIRAEIYRRKSNLWNNGTTTLKFSSTIVICNCTDNWIKTDQASSTSRSGRASHRPTGAMATPEFSWTPLVVVIWLDKNQRLALIFNGWPLLGLGPSSATAIT